MYLTVALPNFSKNPLTYKAINSQSLLGFRVMVPFGRQSKVGIVIAESLDCNLAVEIKKITKVLDQTAMLDNNHIQFLQKTAQYYHISINELILSAAPKECLKESCVTDLTWYTDGAETHPWHDLLLNHRRSSLDKKIKEGKLLQVKAQSSNVVLNTNLPELTEMQKKACLLTSPITLLFGETGSGKTEVYIHLIHDALLKKQQVLYLVPEIALIAQAARKIEKRLGFKPTIIHSMLTQKTKLCHFLKIQYGDAKIILGTRSALLHPIANLGLIIVDEEHDSAYRQEQSLFFSARDAAILRANCLSIPILLGSATPSLESYHNAVENKYHLNRLKRYKALQPNIHLVKRPKHSFISPLLVPIVKKALSMGDHVMLYIGKRGYARLLKCHQCGYELRCNKCDRILIYHQNHSMQCHSCEINTQVIVDCPGCKTAELSHYGAGSQKIAEIASTLWPDHPYLRFDTDIMTPEETAQALAKLDHAEATLIIGTQMLTKGHDIEKLNTVIVIDADHNFYAPDFRAEEKLYAELRQVSGRSGRRSHGDVYIQTQNPDHQLFRMLNKPSAYYTYLLERRKNFSLPPYTHIACLFIRTNSNKITTLTFPEFGDVEISGPFLFPQGKRGKQSCYQIMIKSNNRMLRNHVITTITPIIQKLLSTQDKIITQVDSHLSV
jgi:primosomal protein N' (replication factor Y)